MLLLKLIPSLLAVLILLFYVIAVYWSQEPDDLVFPETQVVGQSTTDAAIGIARTLLEKPGGFISNDIMPPGVFMDDMPAWEYGALVQLRDLVRALRNDFSRSQSQSVEQNDLKQAEPRFNVDRESWMMPTAEDEYAEGIRYLKAYREKLADENQQNAQFYARADNLADWLRTVEKRLGNLSQRLSAAVQQERENIDLSGDPAAKVSTRMSEAVRVKTPWLKIDDVFYEARGSSWALLQILRAVEKDFASVLQKKNATASLRQIIRELEATQRPVWSPMILNGSGFGLLANHSLVMASYIARANAAVIDLRNLLTQG
ncbi:MAG: DUF2333 family protein [Gammaproteobacteria bacterium]|nr:MAG: DUF2333 family protein [Gammaproteobacteria bacterium]